MSWSPGSNGSILFFVSFFSPVFQIFYFLCYHLNISFCFALFHCRFSAPSTLLPSTSLTILQYLPDVCLCATCSPLELKFQVDCEPTRRCSESNPGPLREQFTLLSAELFLQALPTSRSFYFYISRISPLICVWSSAAYSCLSLSTTLAALLSVFAPERLWYSLRFWKSSYRKCSYRKTISLRSCFPPFFFLWDCIQCGIEASR